MATIRLTGRDPVGDNGSSMSASVSHYQHEVAKNLCDCIVSALPDATARAAKRCCSPEERIEHPYPGLAAFLHARTSRDRSVGVGEDPTSGAQP
jgi:hypothetical protein